MRRLTTILFLLSLSASILFAQTYEPLEMKSGGMLGARNLRFILNWAYLENDIGDTSVFDFGLDFGISPAVELQNRISYLSSGDSDYEWEEWTELLKFKLGKVLNGPAYALGTGLRIPVHKYESLGLIAGLYISSAIKDIDFDFNLGFEPIYLTYADLGGGMKVRPNSLLNINLRLGYKFTPFLKLAGGFELNQLLEGKRKIKENDHETTETISGGSAWNFIFGARVKPIDYPIVVDCSLSLGASKRSPYDWRIKIGVQLQPQSPNAEW